MHRRRAWEYGERMAGLLTFDEFHARATAAMFFHFALSDFGSLHGRWCFLMLKRDLWCRS